MPNPSISQRLHYRLPPSAPTEPTSTLVLTSKDGHYIDVRVSLSHYDPQRSLSTHSADCIDWAFAGRSRNTPIPTTKSTTTGGDGAASAGKKRWHTVWEHWIDTHHRDGEEGGSDEGDMTELEDGTVLEEGINALEDGTEQRYEELWRDLPIVPLGTKGRKNSVVLRAEDGEGGRGVVVKIGGWCQGIWKGVAGGWTVERWELGGEGREEGEGRTRNGWVRVLRVGEGELPCKDVCERSWGKLGMSTEKEVGGVEWRVLEEYYW